MSGKYFIVLIVFLFCSSIKAQDANQASFDPFEGRAVADGIKSSSDSGPVIPQVEFNNNDIAMAFQIITDLTGWSIFPTSEVSKAKITLFAKNVTAGDLLDTVIKMSGFLYHREGTLITVMTYDEYTQFYGLAKEVFCLKSINAASVDMVIKPFITKCGKSIVHPESNTLVVYDTQASVKYIASIIDALEKHVYDKMVLEVIDVKYADAELISEKLQKIFERQSSSQGKTASSAPQDASKGNTPQGDGGKLPAAASSGEILSPQSTVFIQPLGRTNQLIVSAFKNDMDNIKQFVTKLDTYVEPTTHNYQLIYVDASEIFNGLEKILNLDGQTTSSGRQSEKSQGLTLIEKTNSILLTGQPATHRIMTSIIENIDKPNTYETGMIRIYKLENAAVEEVAKTISELLKADSTQAKSSEKMSFNQKGATSNVQTQSGAAMAQSEEFVPQIEARVSTSKSTNSVIVQATTRQHMELEKLIKELDTKRKQVLIEAMIVELTTKDNLDLGVELGHAKDNVSGFTNFGLSKNLNPKTGERDVLVTPGGTAAVFKPESLQVVVKAIQQSGNAKITSAPRILVNDNAVGYIKNIDEEPTTQTNQGNTTTTVSFAGYVEAGTQFAITPHISENNDLRVEYQITLNSFGTKSANSDIPPARSTDTIQSEATVPNGNTIIVGGMQTVSDKKNVDKVPLLGDIPFVGELFKSTKIEKQFKTTYLFITPNIMKSPNYSDLTQVSQKALSAAKTGEAKKTMENCEVNDTKQSK